MSEESEHDDYFVRSPAEDQEETYNHSKAYAYAFLCAIGFGIGNEILGQVSAKHGSNAIFPQFIIMILLWALFHIVQYLQHENKKQVDFDEIQSLNELKHGEKENSSYFSKANSSYFTEEVKPTNEGDYLIYEDERANGYDQEILSTCENSPRLHQMEYKFNLRKFSVPFRRCLISGLTNVFIALTFKYGALSHINSGVIASIFSTSVIFTSIIFYFIFKQKLSRYDAIGIAMIILCVIMIGLGQDTSAAGDQTKLVSSNHHLFLAVFFALLVGLCFSIQNLDLYVCLEQIKFPVLQMNFDSNLLIGLIYIPFFINVQYNQPVGATTFTLYDIFMSNLSLLLCAMALICLSFALMNGKAGTVQAITNSSVLIQTILATFVTKEIPTLMQILGLATGFLGMTVILKAKG